MIEFFKRFIKEICGCRYWFLDGPYRFKKWKLDCKKYIGYKRYHIK